jgi:NADPH:quinone reductase-like Zn-dependent oxidoreductase
MVTLTETRDPSPVRFAAGCDVSLDLELGQRGNPTSETTRSARIAPRVICHELRPGTAKSDRELPDPEPKAGHVLIAVKAFGVNQAETHMRKGDWAEAAEVSGIECVGEVVAAPGGEFRPGDKVAAFMSGMGRTINGSYAELTLVPATDVVKIATDMPWEEFAVIPESYSTAWTCLYGNLQIEKGQTLLRRGATSALGQAALNIAANAGLKVTATTRNKARFEKLLRLGAQSVEIEDPGLSKRLPEAKKVDVVLDLVGNSTLLDSIAIPPPNKKMLAVTQACFRRTACRSKRAFCGPIATIADSMRR